MRLHVPTHPYRDSEPPFPQEPLEASGVARDDLFVALLLLVVGALGVLCGLSMDRQAQLTVGLGLIAFALKVAWDARTAGHS